MPRNTCGLVDWQVRPPKPVGHEEAGQHFGEQQAGGPAIVGRRLPEALSGLRRHVGDVQLAGAMLIAHVLGAAEVHQHRVASAFVQQHILGPHIAVHQA